MFPNFNSSSCNLVQFFIYLRAEVNNQGLITESALMQYNNINIHKDKIKQQIRENLNNNLIQLFIFICRVNSYKVNNINNNNNINK
jgi:hypothetical protein